MIYYRLDENGKKIYTLSQENTTVAVPAKFSVEDKNSVYRIKIKRRFGIPPFDE
ncbi:NOP10 [Enterospora canceri]|uniref:H/ACA ribonucleoprotein complex subunit NOP10 n=1 Tax=Enterospora canceri TaxID=1081671 RepID=A0A1Y1S420_9MICR|nr:NOP10 [Enterospora canceri]